MAKITDLVTAFQNAVTSSDNVKSFQELYELGDINAKHDKPYPCLFIVVPNSIISDYRDGQEKYECMLYMAEPHSLNDNISKTQRVQNLKDYLWDVVDSVANTYHHHYSDEIRPKIIPNFGNDRNIAVHITVYFTLTDCRNDA